MVRLNGVSLYGEGALDGSMHMKAVILNHSIAYAGSSNLTKASRVNREFSFRMAGQSATEIFCAVLEVEQAVVCKRV